MGGAGARLDGHDEQSASKFMAIDYSLWDEFGFVI